jgi:Kef-type K+ transport system membrane component KefB
MNESVLLYIGIILAVGTVLGHVTHKLKLTGVVGYIIAGVLLWPLTRSLGYFGITESEISTMWEITTKLTLALIAFIIGAHLTIRTMRRLGKPLVAMILGESFGAFLLVFAGAYIVTGDISLSLLLAALAPASAPAGTVAVLHEYHAHGPLTDAILAVVGWDDAIAVLIFAGALGAIKLSLGGAVGALGILEPIREIVGAIVIGTAVGGVLLFSTKRIRNPETLFIATVTAIFLGAGLSDAVGFSLILSSMVLGMVVINIMPSMIRTPLHTLESLMPPIYVLFFALAGTQLHPELVPAMGVLGLAYVLGRSLGLIGGASISAKLTGAPAVIQKYLGLGILSQAGVAIGLAAFAGSELAPLGGEALATQAITLIMATTVVFEIIGPIGVRYAITKAGEAGHE